MFEYGSVSASAYDVTSLINKLNDKAKEGWDVVSIVPTGGDVTAFLKREGSTDGASTTEAEAAVPAAAAATASVTEPAGWAAAPEETAAEAALAEAAPAEAEGAVAAAAAEPTAETAASAPEEEAAPAAAAAATTVSTTPAGWYPDPSGRYEMRYWDGEKWTEHVSRQGQTFTDPPVA